VPEDAKTFRILDLEDDQLDAELIQANLAEGGIPCEITRVETREEFVAALKSGDFELILSDYSLPAFDGLSALKFAKEIRPEVPFILVSGAIGEERAIETLKSGATDYVLKQRLERLVPAVRRAVREAEERTERRRAEEALRRSEERHRLLVDNVEDYAIFMVDPNGHVLDWNVGAERIFGYREAEIVGEPSSILFTPEDIRGGAPERELKRAEKEGRAVDERWHMRKDGSRFWASGFVRPIRGDAGNLRGFAKIARDITERKMAEEAMREVREAERNRIARDLHDGVLQDLSYTSAAMGLISLKAEGTGLEGELQKTIDAVRRAAQGLRNAVNDLRLEEERNRPFSELVASLVERNRGMAGDCKIGLEVEGGFPTTSFGDAGTEILRVIQEALTNARRHSGARNVQVTLSKIGDELVAEVSDDGRGFGLGTTTPGGVGLKSIRERVVALGGKLDLESKVGEGTRVRLRVPMPQSG
jgi:PAS domain S-box-containing protein